MTKKEASIKQFQKAVKRLKDALKQKKNEFIRDSAIQRFEFTFDLSWKVIKEFLEENHGVLCSSPKSCFREAYKQGLLDYDDIWMKMTDKRNLTAHTYHEETAEEIYSLLPGYLSGFEEILKKIE